MLMQSIYYLVHLSHIIRSSYKSIDIHLYEYPPFLPLLMDHLNHVLFGKLS